MEVQAFLSCSGTVGSARELAIGGGVSLQNNWISDLKSTAETALRYTISRRTKAVTGIWTMIGSRHFPCWHRDTDEDRSWKHRTAPSEQCSAACAFPQEVEGHGDIAYAEKNTDWRPCTGASEEQTGLPWQEFRQTCELQQDDRCVRHVQENPRDQVGSGG